MNLEQIYNDFIYMLGIAGTLKHSSYTLSRIKLKWTDSNSLLYKKKIICIIILFNLLLLLFTLIFLIIKCDKILFLN